MHDLDAKRDWLTYADWGSFLCGSLALLLTIAAAFYIDFSQKRPLDLWESRYIMSAAPLSFVGVLLGMIGRDTPRLAGLVLSAGVLLRVVAGAIAM